MAQFKRKSTAKAKDAERQPTPAVTEPSPCRQLCDLSPERLCTGCGRTLDEIRDWSAMSEQQKRECKARAEQRLQALFE